MADVQLTITIPEQYITRVSGAIVGAAGKVVHITIDEAGSPLPPARVWYTYEPRQDGETILAFARRAVLQLVRALVRAHELGVDIARVHVEREAVTPAAESVPEDIVA